MIKRKKSTPLSPVITLERIKELAIIGVFRDDSLMEILALKGGNALDIIYKLGTRASVDVDLSMPADFPGGIVKFKNTIEKSLKETFLEEGLVAFDFKVVDKPEALTEDLAHFWGGYDIEFKLIPYELWEKHQADLPALQKRALSLGKGTRFMLDVSRHEFLTGKVAHDLDGYRVFVYSPAMILAEKLRALCQQLPDYAPIIKRTGRPGNSRAKDFLDIYYIAQQGIDIGSKENKELLNNIFRAKYVPIEFLDQIKNQRAFHASSFYSLKDTVKAIEKLQPFDFYFDQVIALIERLKPFRNV